MTSQSDFVRPPPLNPSIVYSVERITAGNSLFLNWPGSYLAAKAGVSELYEESALLLKRLVAAGLIPAVGYRLAITRAAEGLSKAAAAHASDTNCAEYVLFCLQGLPQPGKQKAEARYRAMIGTTYANICAARSLRRASQ